MNVNSNAFLVNDIFCKTDDWLETHLRNILYFQKIVFNMLLSKWTQFAN